MMTREEHLAWCKQRALEYLDQGDLANAVVSMLSDMNKHDETRNPNPAIAALGIIFVQNYDDMSVRHWIEGFR